MKNIEHVAGFLIESNKLFLICLPTGHKNINHQYSLPKGHIEINETSLQTAIRETFEETNLDINKIQGEIKYLGNYQYSNKKKDIDIYHFKTINNITNKNLQCSSIINKECIYKGLPEHCRFEWVSLQDAIKLLHPVYKASLNMLI